MIFKMDVKPTFTVENEAAISAPPKVDFSKPGAAPAAPATPAPAAPASPPAPKADASPPAGTAGDTQKK
jgi:LemA protein